MVFSAADERLLVDLPGYGFARVTEQLRRHWQRVISTYLTQRRTLVGMIVVMDVRRPLQDLDTEFLALCTAAELPVHILLSKADKISRGAAKATLQQTEASLRGRGWETSVQLFSSLSGDGVDPARDLLLRWWKEGRPRLESKGDFARAGA